MRAFSAACSWVSPCIRCPWVSGYQSQAARVASKVATFAITLAILISASCAMPKTNKSATGRTTNVSTKTEPRRRPSSKGALTRTSRARAIRLYPTQMQAHSAATGPGVPDTPKGYPARRLRPARTPRPSPIFGGREPAGQASPPELYSRLREQRKPQNGLTKRAAQERRERVLFWNAALNCSWAQVKQMIMTHESLHGNKNDWRVTPGFGPDKFFSQRSRPATHSFMSIEANHMSCLVRMQAQIAPISAHNLPIQVFKFYWHVATSGAGTRPPGIPLPICPSLLSPQQYTRPCGLIAQVCPEPAAIAENP